MIDKATIGDVAKESDVSIRTVSRVLNSHKYVSEDVRKRVWDTIERLKYSPLQEAKNLALQKRRKGRTGNIGCVIFSGFSKYSQPYHVELLECIDNVLLQSDYHNYFTCSLKELENPAVFLRMVNPGIIDGCLLIGIGDECQDEIVKIRQRIPHVVSLGYLKGSDISCVYADYSEAGRMATAHLVSLGHKRIGCVVGYLDRPGLRFPSYKKALAEAGLAYDKDMVVEGKGSVEDAYNAAKHLLERTPPPTGIFVFSDLMAVGVYKAIQEKGLTIPKDISVVSCDNVRLSAQLHPSLTTVGTDKDGLTRAVIRTLFDEIDGKSKPGIRIVFPVQLYERDSCRRI